MENDFFIFYVQKLVLAMIKNLSCLTLKDLNIGTYVQLYILTLILPNNEKKSNERVSWHLDVDWKTLLQSAMYKISQHVSKDDSSYHMKDFGRSL